MRNAFFENIAECLTPKAPLLLQSFRARFAQAAMSVVYRFAVVEADRYVKHQLRTLRASIKRETKVGMTRERATTRTTTFERGDTRSLEDGSGLAAPLFPSPLLTPAQYSPTYKSHGNFYKAGSGRVRRSPRRQAELDSLELLELGRSQ